MVLTKFSLRMVKEEEYEYADKKDSLGNPEAVYNLINDVLALHEVPIEQAWVIHLNTRGCMIGIELISQGGASSAVIHPADVYRAAIVRCSVSIIMVHNHPSGDPKPSEEDISSAKALKEAGKMLGIKLLDSIIVGDGRYTSLAEQRLL